MIIKNSLYVYKGYVESVYDGDTARITLDLGCNIRLYNEPIRIFGIDAPEMRGEFKEAGKLSRDFLREQILHKEVFVRTVKDKKGKYGRLLGHIYTIDGNAVDAMMVGADHAVFKKY